MAPAALVPDHLQFLAEGRLVAVAVADRGLLLVEARTGRQTHLVPYPESRPGELSVAVRTVSNR